MRGQGSDWGTRDVAEVPGHRPEPRGFTDGDLEKLRQAHRSGIVAYGWGRAQFVINHFSQYFAIWSDAPSGQEEPALSIIQFDKTGTYALLLGGKIIASGKRLGDILPTLAAIGSRTIEE